MELSSSMKTDGSDRVQLVTSFINKKIHLHLPGLRIMVFEMRYCHTHYFIIEKNFEGVEDVNGDNFQVDTRSIDQVSYLSD